jgi:hypothetical protein
MVVVALSAVALGAYTSRLYSGRRDYLLKRAEVYAARRQEYAERAIESKRRAEAFLRVAEGVEGSAAEKSRRSADEELLRASLYKRIAEFDATMEARYRGAAERPWEAPPAEASDPTRSGLGAVNPHPHP